MSDHVLRIARAVETMTKAVTSMAASQEKISETVAKLQHPAFRGRTENLGVIVVEEMSTTVSLELPDIPGSTTIYRQNDGFLRVEILIEPDNADRLVGLVDSMGIREFVISAAD